MSEVDKGYELKVLKMVLNKYLDETILATEEGLTTLETNFDQVVWELATKIYKQSGNKVELCTVRDVVNSRIRELKSQIATEKKLAAEKKVIADTLVEFSGDESRTKVFVRLRSIISEQLSVDESKVTLKSHLAHDLGGDGFELIELVMGLEEEFDIEISDSESEDQLDIIYGTPKTLSEISSSSSSNPYAHDGGGGPNCVVENFLNFICGKVSV